MSDETPAVQDNAEAQRFELTIDQHTAELQYRRRPDGTLVLVHTEVPTALQGRGLGGVLAKAALESARSAGIRVVAQCPFVAGYVKKHPEYEPLVV